MNEHQVIFNQRVNYGKQWYRNGLVRELCRNQSNTVTICSEHVFEQFGSPYFHTFEVSADELREIV